MPRPRKYPTNAARQKAYRIRRKPPEEKFVTIPRRVLEHANLIRSMVKEGDEVMVTCAAYVYKTSRRVIRAIIRPPFFW